MRGIRRAVVNKTTVIATDEDVAIVEFGAFAWKDGKWVNSETFTGKPFAAAEFADWYKCPKAELKKGQKYADPTNWCSDPKLQDGKWRWYFVGINTKGKKVKGEGVVELKGEIDPKKPKNAE
jgi:hypothetical protein